MSSFKYHRKGTQNLTFDSFTVFKQRIEQEEESTHTTYVRDDSVYHPKSGSEVLYPEVHITTEHSSTHTKKFCVRILPGTIVYVVGMTNTMVIQELYKLNSADHVQKLPES